MTTPNPIALAEEVLKLDKEATPGPWTLGGIFNPGTSSAFRYVYPPKNLGRSPLPLAINVAVSDASLIEVYRTAAPILAIEIQRLTAELAEAKRKANRMMEAAIAFDLVVMLNHDPISARHELKESINDFAALTTSERP